MDIIQDFRIGLLPRRIDKKNNETVLFSIIYASTESIFYYIFQAPDKNERVGS
jgi:hypothetical protein